MEDYPAPYLKPVRPFIVLSGLQHEANAPLPLPNGAAVSSASPPLDREDVLQAFMLFNSSEIFEASAQAAGPRDVQSMKFRLKPSNRRYVFPSRKASPLPSQMNLQSTAVVTSTPSHSLHSPLSPLSPGSGVYPDGLLSPLWFVKYQEALPSAFVSFFGLSANPMTDTLNDNELKNEILALKTALTENANYKGRYAVVIVGDSSTSDDADITERLANIRRTTKLDNKVSFFYLPPDTLGQELVQFAEHVLQSLRPACLELARNLLKHSRRKRDRRSSNPATPILEGVPQHLLQAGWNVRYAVKVGVLSEIRLELDAASRSYEEALDYLLNSPEGCLTRTDPWSPRWNENRCLCDCIAIRKARCMLADGYTASTASFWVAYRDRIKDLVDTQGKGSSSYAWELWEARWSKIMAQLVLESAHFASDSLARKNLESLTHRKRFPYTPSAKILDQYHPWQQCLHQPAYWLALSAEHQQVRAALAAEIPDSDKSPPDQSPAAALTRVHSTYDTFLANDPHIEGTSVNHAREIASPLEACLGAFSERRQHVNAQLLRSKLGNHLSQDSPKQASAMLIELWKEDRASGRYQWRALSRSISRSLSNLSTNVNDIEHEIATHWELLPSFLDTSGHLSHGFMDLVAGTNRRCQEKKSHQVVQIDGDMVSSFLMVSVCFESAEAYAGEKIRLQLVLRSLAPANAAPLEFTSVTLSFDGLKDIVIKADSNMSPSEEDCLVALTDIRENEYSASLKVFPGQSQALIVSLNPREVKSVSALRAVLEIDRPWLKVRYSKDLRAPQDQSYWYVNRRSGLIRQRKRWDAAHVSVLPKPAKLRIRIPDLAEVYYTNEQARLEVEIVNEEIYDVEAEVKSWLNGLEERSQAKITILDKGGSQNTSIRDGASSHSIGTIIAASSRKITLIIDMPSSVPDQMSLELDVRYSPVGDADLQVLHKLLSTKLQVLEPFLPNFALTPLLHPEPWPSFFDSKACRLQMRWQLILTLVAKAAEEIVIIDSGMELETVSEGASCVISTRIMEAVSLSSSDQFTKAFSLDVSKKYLDDFQPIIVDSSMRVVWRRASEDTRRTTTLIPSPRLNLPTSEPRALASLHRGSEDGSMQLRVICENPSMHYLAFETSIEPTDDFIVSGATKQNFNLVPFSRHHVDFTILPMVQNQHLRPLVKVLDTYYQKLLRVHPGEGFATDERGMLIWIDEV